MSGGESRGIAGFRRGSAMPSQRLEAFQRESADERRGTYRERRRKSAGCGGGQGDEVPEPCGAGLEARHAQREEEQREAGEGDGQRVVLRLAEIHGRNGSTLFAGDQLGLRHVARNGVRRIVERQLVPQSPGEDTEAEQHESDAEEMEAAAAGYPAGTA